MNATVKGALVASGAVPTRRARSVPAWRLLLAVLATLVGMPAASAHANSDVPLGFYTLQDTPADSLHREAQAALRRSEHQRAAELFRAVRTRYPRAGVSADAAYWEAFALQRLGGRQNLSTALGLLREQRSAYPDASSLGDARSLAARIEGQLASGGDAASAQRLIGQAERMAGTCPREDEDERLMVLDALLTMDSERAMPTLKSVLARRDECSAVLRRKAVFLVSRKRTPETEDILVSTLRSDPDKEVREQAVFWLGQVNSEKSTTALLDVLRTSQDDAVLEKAVFALGQQRSERARTALRDLARRSDVAVAVRGQVIFWLGQRSGNAEESVRFLTELYPTLNDDDLKQRVLFALSQQKTPAALAFLRGLATSSRESMDVRRTALFHAGRAGLGIAPLVEILRSTTDRDFRQHVVFVIGSNKTAEAVDALMDIVKSDSDLEVRKTAIFWLGQSKDPRASEFLLTILNR